MLRLFNRFLIFVLILSGALYIIFLNREPATLRLSRSYEFSGSAGYLYISVFLVGLFFAGLVALLFGIRSYFRERHFIQKERQREQFYDLFVHGRSLMAAQEWTKAQAVWERVLARDSENITARIQLSICYEALGDTEEALRVLDLARSQRAYNAEVLFRAADLNTRLGNRTAAVDNLALLMSETPSPHAARVAAELSEELGRLEDALQYQEQLESMSPRLAEQERERKTRLQFKILVRDNTADSQTRIEALQGFVKRNPSYTPALDELAAVQQTNGQVEQAAQTMIKAAKISNDSDRWGRIVNMWLSSKAVGNEAAQNTERALAAARAATAETKGSTRVLAELALARTLLAVNKIDEAKTVLNKIEVIAEREGVKLSLQERLSLLTLRGACSLRLGEIREASELWNTALAVTFPKKTDNVVAFEDMARPASRNLVQPSPTFSTP